MSTITSFQSKNVDKIPDFCRRQWVSSAARSTWEPRLSAIGQQWAAAERASVGDIRSAALQSISPEQLLELSQRAIKAGLVGTPLEFQGRAEDYAASAVPINGWPDYRFALMMPDVTARFLDAWHAGDDETIGQLLGYPKCCRDFFAKTWGAGSVDPTWEMADHGDGPLEANILLRWLGVRYVPHLPCGFQCEGTVKLGRKLRALIPTREREWMDELLAMPMLWSALNGIGEVVTPIVTLNFRSDRLMFLREIRRQGEYYPEAGAHGIRFPYRRTHDKRLEFDPYLWTDNGFSSLDAMNAGHEMILSALNAHMAGVVSRISGATGIIDLGAGNGELLHKLGWGIGIESDEGRVARRIWPDVRLGRIQELEELFSPQYKRFAVAIISMRRFEELSSDENKKLRMWLESSVDNVLIYQYEHPQFSRIVAPRDLPIPEVA